MVRAALGPARGRIGRGPSPLAGYVPAASVVVASFLAALPIVFILGVLAPYGDSARWDGLVQTLLFGVAMIGAMLIGGRHVLPRLFAQAARAKNPELFLSASLLVVILASVATTAIGLSPIV